MTWESRALHTEVVDKGPKRCTNCRATIVKGEKLVVVAACHGRYVSNLCGKCFLAISAEVAASLDGEERR